MSEYIRMPGYINGLCDSGHFVRKEDSSVYPPGKFGPVPQPLVADYLPCERGEGCVRCRHLNLGTGPGTCPKREAKP